jgi:hypothetical protein
LAEESTSLILDMLPLAFVRLSEKHVYTPALLSDMENMVCGASISLTLSTEVEKIE